MKCLIFFTRPIALLTWFYLLLVVVVAVMCTGLSLTGISLAEDTPVCGQRTVGMNPTGRVGRCARASIFLERPHPRRVRGWLNRPATVLGLTCGMRSWQLRAAESRPYAGKFHWNREGFRQNFLVFRRAAQGTAATRDPEIGGRTWIRTREGVSQQIYSLPSLAT